MCSDRSVQTDRAAVATRTAGHAISRMPRAVRDRVSRCIEDGGTWRDVAAICAEAGFLGVRATNVTNYRARAHKEWLAREDRLESVRRESDVTAAIMREYAANGGSPAEAGLLRAAEILTEALQGMSAGDLRALVAEEPGKFFGVVQGLSKIVGMVQKERHTAPAATPAPEGGGEAAKDPREAIREIYGI